MKSGSNERRPRVLFLCTGNSCHSQMAEGFARQLRGDALEAWSAGIEAHGLNPYMVKVMAEAGIDAGRQRSKRVGELDVVFDYVVTVCSHADEHCPAWPARTKVIHHGFDDPPRLAAGLDGEQEKLEIYRRVRDEIRAFIETLPQALEGHALANL